MANWGFFKMGPADMWFYGCKDVMKNFTNLYDFLFDNFFLNGEYHRFAKSIENNYGDISNSIAFYKFWMIKNNLWDNKIVLDSTWE